MITEPPVFIGALHASASCALPLVTVTEVGAAGVVFGVTVVPALATLVPNALVAVSVTAYSRPLTNSPMVQVSAPVFHVQVRAVSAGVPDAVAVAVYRVIGEPPIFVGAVKVTTALWFPAVTLVIAGTPGAPRTSRILEAEVKEPTPTPFFDATRKMYFLPASRLVTVALSDAETPSSKVCHEIGDSSEYWTT